MGVEFKRNGTTEAISGYVQNISIGGMFIESETVLAFGDEVSVRFAPTSASGTFELPAVVRWTTPSGMGVQFKSIGVRETRAITDLAAALEKK